MIAHPLTLLFCWLIGVGLSNALGYVLEFLGELCADVQRYGWTTPGFFETAMLVLGGTAVFAAGFFTGAAMRLLAEKTWRLAAFWALLASFLSHPRSPGLLLWAAPGCVLGAYLCGRFREERWLDAAEGFLRNWMFWERGGAL